VIMAVAQGVPSIGIGLSRKFDDLFDRLHMTEYVMPVDGLDAGELYGRVQRALANPAKWREGLIRETAVLAELSAASMVLFRKWVDEQKAAHAES